jgi:hypothetical protein
MSLALLVIGLRLCILSPLGRGEHSEPEEIELGTAIHASFNQLETGDVSLGGTVPLLPRSSRKDRLFILRQTTGKGP